MNIFKVIIAISSLVFAGCSSTPKTVRVVIDSSGDKPSWSKDGRFTYEQEGFVFFKAKETVRGDQRENGCRDLASMDAREQMLRGISDDVKGALDNAQTDISENAELILGKVRSGKWSGEIYGMADADSYFERYRIGETERIDCFVLAKISKADYQQTKRSIVEKIVAIDPRIKEAITKKQVDFFSEHRNPSSSAE